MTAQIHDSVFYDGADYSLVGVGGAGLFDPAEHGLAVRMIHTACWRGYICGYTVDEEELFLTSLQVGMDDPPAKLFGARVQTGSGTVYAPIREPVQFTGGLLLGAGFLRELYVHMGFHPAWKYERVVELLFDNGELTAAHDRSAAMAQRRSAQGSLQPTDPKDTKDWIETAFDRNYDSPV